MRFYEHDITKVVDVSVTKSGQITVHYYPHNDLGYVETYIRTRETEISRYIEQMKKVNESDDLFTVKLENKGIEKVSRSDFSKYFASREPKTEMFIFEVKPEDGGFPSIYVMEQNSRSGPYEWALPIFAYASHDVIDPVSQQTDVGKRFVWMLYNSWIHQEFKGETPAMGSISIPTNGKDEIPAFLNTTKLKEWGEKIGIRLKGKTKTEKEPEIVNADLSGSRVTNPFGEINVAQLESWVAEGMRKSASVNLTDICALSLSKTLEMVENPDNIISVQLDTIVGARKMCIYHGQVYYIPSRKDFFLGDYFGEDEEIFVKCDDDTFPKYLLPSPK
jgi:hypothetical protein